MKINPAFENVIGQDIAKTRLSESIAAAKNGGNMLSPLMTAEPGVGKSLLGRGYVKALHEQLGFDVLSFDNPAEFRSKGGAFSDLMDIIVNSPKYAIFIDEAHGLNERSTVQLEKVKAFLMKALDKGNENKAIRFDDELVVHFNRSRGSIILATNFPDRLDKSGAFQSRCDSIALETYNEQQLIDILQIMLTNEGFQEAHDGTLGMIARCGRGTARPMEKIVGQLKISNQASDKPKKTINKEDVISALRLSKMFPRGLAPWEVQILMRTTTPVRDNCMMAIMPAIEPNTYKKAKGYLMGECGYLSQTPQGIQRTQRGTDYLNQIKQAGFQLPG